jgi:hypothetical protein
MPSIRFETRERDVDGGEAVNQEILPNQFRLVMMGMKAGQDYVVKVEDKSQQIFAEVGIMTDSGGSFYDRIVIPGNKKNVVSDAVTVSYTPNAAPVGPWVLGSSSRVAVTLSEVT